MRVTVRDLLVDNKFREIPCVACCGLNTMCTYCDYRNRKDEMERLMKEKEEYTRRHQIFKSIQSNK